MEFEFGKNGTVESLDRVPEQFRSLFQEQDGKYVLGEAYKGVAQAVDGLNRSLRAARKDADEAKRNRPDLSPFVQIGQMLGLEGDDALNPEALRGAVEQMLQKIAEGDKQGKVNWDKMKRDLENAHRRALEAKESEVKAMHSTLVKHLVTSQAVQAIAAHKGVPELLLPHISSRTKVIKEGDEYVVRVVDEAGDPRGNASGGYMTIEELVKEMKASPIYGRAFESEAPSGSGTRPGSTGGRVPVPAGELTPTQKIARGLAQRR